jgi:exonuclease SbcC
VNQHWIEDTLQHYLEDLTRKVQSYRLHDCAESARFTCCLTSSCLAAFFCIVPERATLEGFVAEAEDEIRTWRDERSWTHQDLSLVLFLQESPSLQLLSDLRRDTTLCRKFPLVPSDPVDLHRQLAYLPFVPLDTGEALSLRVLSLDPLLLLRQSGAARAFASALVAHKPGAEALAQQVIDPDYVLTDKGGTSEEVRSSEPSRATQDSGDSQCDVALDAVALSNFRGIGRKVHLQLGSAVTVLYGINGTGKTSVCDAIEWAVAGSLARAEEQDDDARAREAERSVINYFSEADFASVELTFDSMGTRVARRMSQDLKQIVTASSGNSDWGAILTATRSQRRKGFDLRRARDAFRSCHILEQSTIRDFLERSPSDRFEALNRILGYEEFVHLARKLSFVSNSVQKEGRTREPRRAQAEQGLREAQSAAEALTTAIKQRETAVTDQPAADQLLQAIVEEARSRDLPLPAAPNSRATQAIIAWLIAAAEVLNAVDSSLKDQLHKISECLNLAQEVEVDRQEHAALSKKVAEMASEEKELREKGTNLESELRQIAANQKDLRKSRDRAQQAAAPLQWAKTNSLALKQEEKRLSAEQEQLASLDEKSKERQSELNAGVTQQDATAAALAEATQQEHAARVGHEGLEEVKRVHPEWTAAVSRLESLKQEEQRLAKGIADHGAKLSASEAHHAEELKALARRKESLAAEEALASQRARLLAELRQTLHPSETSCPFCGHAYESHAELLVHMEDVQEAPTENHRLAAGKAQDKQKEFASLQCQIESRRKELAGLERQKSENVERQSATTTRLSQIRDKAVSLGVLPKDANAATVPEMAHINAALADINLSSIRRKIQDLQAQQQDLRSKARELQDTTKALNAERDALAARIQQRRTSVSALRDQAADADALEFLPLPHEELSARLDHHRQTVQKKSSALREADVKAQHLARDRDVAVQRADTLRRQILASQERMVAIAQREAELKTALLSIGVEGDLSPTAVIKSQATVEARISGIHGLRQKCSALSSIVQLRALHEESDKAQEQVRAAKASLEQASKDIRQITKKVREIDQVAASFQQRTVRDMTARLNALAAPLNSIFERLNGHPFFGALRIEPHEKGKTVTFRVETPQNSESTSAADVPPRSYLSDAQLNIVALSIFLSIALYQTWSKFRLIVVDDPVQQMDDLNAASFIDLIREIAIQNRRQFLLTTCNDEFYKLALSKLSCLNTRDMTRFRAYRLEGLRQEGPEIIVDAPYWENDEMQGVDAA